MFSPVSAALAPSPPAETAEEAAYRDAQILARCHVLGPWALACAFDLGGCDPQRTRDAEQIRRFGHALHNLIGAQPWGEPMLLRIGAAGRPAALALVQPGEGSLVSAHFVEEGDGVYVDILSAVPYRPYLAADFCRRWFAADSVAVTVMLRRAVGRAPGDGRAY